MSETNEEKKSVIEILMAAGIKVKNGKISVKDIEEAKKVIDTANSDVEKELEKAAKKIMALLKSIGVNSKKGPFSHKYARPNIEIEYDGDAVQKFAKQKKLKPSGYHLVREIQLVLRYLGLKGIYDFTHVDMPKDIMVTPLKGSILSVRKKRPYFTKED